MEFELFGGGQKGENNGAGFMEISHIFATQDVVIPRSLEGDTYALLHIYMS